MSSDAADAKARGVIYAPKLKNALNTKAVQTVTRDGAVVTFPGTVDFSPKLRLVRWGKATSRRLDTRREV